MLNADVRALLASPHVARLSVVDPNGYPHTVPLWYAVDGDDIVMISVRDTRKVDYVRTNAKASICIGGGEGAGSEVGAGYLLKGNCRAEEDDNGKWLRLITHRYRSPDDAAKDIAQWQELDIIVLRLVVTKVIKVY